MTSLQTKYYYSFLPEEKVTALQTLSDRSQLEDVETLCDYSALNAVCSVLTAEERAQFLTVLSTSSSVIQVDEWLRARSADVKTAVSEALDRTLFLVETVTQS